MMPRFACIALATCVLSMVGATSAQDRTGAIDAESLFERLDSAETRISELELRNSVSPAPSNEPASDEPEAENSELQAAARESDLYSPRFHVDYDRGFVIRPFDAEATPFELTVNARMQFRYSGFHRDRDTFLNRGGVVPVRSRSDFEIERARLKFQGFFLDPKLEYYISINADTDSNHNASFFDFWIDYAFSEAFKLYVGKRKVPGSYDWVASSVISRFADRSIATTFFRTNRSLGVWAAGEVVDDVYYQAAVTNGVNTTDLKPGDVDNRFAYSAMMYWDPLGDVGDGFSDLEYHEDLVIRLGHTFTYANQDDADDGSPTGEEQYARLSDGTRLTTTGALAPGTTVNDFDAYLYTVFLTGKYRGFSFNAEYFARWLQNFGTSEGLPLPHSSLFDDGFFAEGGYMLVPKKLELNGRVSQVDGMFGDAWEYAGGVNWFFNGSHSHKLTFDASILDGNPASNSSPNYEIGQDGVLFRVQYQAMF